MKRMDDWKKWEEENVEKIYFAKIFINVCASPLGTYENRKPRKS